MNVFFYGYGGSSIYAEELRPLIEDLNCTLTTIHEWENANIKWNRHTVLQQLSKADVIILPCNYKIQNAKSNNRLTQAFALGKPVICSPLSAYLDILNNIPKNSVKPALIATTKDEWSKAIQYLKNHPEIRELMSQSAFKISKDFSLETITKKWLDVLQNTEKTDIIIPNYNNVEYLKLCIDSIKRNTNNYNIIISDAGSNKQTWDFLKSLKNVTVLGSANTRLNFSESCNAAIKNSKSKYFVLLNSDTIVSENWLKNLIKTIDKTPNLAACGVLSNCDKTWRHTFEMKVNDNLNLHPGMKLEQILPFFEDLQKFMKNSNEQFTNHFVERDWCAFYSTIISRKSLEDIGYLDTNFKSGCEDLDFCIRLNKAGYIMGETYSSFVFHFGGVSRGAYQLENKEVYDLEDKYNHEFLAKKWATNV